MYYVYLITNQENLKRYIGVTNNVERRMREHLRRAKNHSKDACSKLAHAIRKYGEERFTCEVLFETEEKLAAFDAETIFIRVFNSFANGYNSSHGGEGSDRIVPWNKGTKGKARPNKGSLTSEQMTGEKHFRSKLSDAQRLEIFIRLRAGESPKALAQEYGVVESTIHRARVFIKRQQTAGTSAPA